MTCAPCSGAPVRHDRFADVLDLARLPYFEVAPGDRLVLADRSLAGAIDMHTHLAMAFFRKLRVDLRRETPRTEHYLPVRGRPVDMTVYQNANYSEEDLRRMRRDLTFASLTAGGMRATHTVPNLAREMRDLGIARSVILPIDLPLVSENARNVVEAAGDRADFVCFGSVHPFLPRLECELDRQVARGIRGVKVHPAYQVVRPDHPRAMRLYALCGARGLPVLMHCGPVGIEPGFARELTQLARYEAAVAENPATTFVLGHAGALQMEQALAIAVRHPNVLLEISGQSLENVRRLIAEAGPHRVLFGTDWPWYPQAIALAKVLMATEGDDAARRKVLHENATALLGGARARSGGAAVSPSKV